MWCMYTMDYYSVIKSNKLMPFAAAWMDLEMITLSEVGRQSKTDTIKYFLQDHI